MQRLSPDLDMRPGSMARTILETYALTAAMTAPPRDYGTGLLDLGREAEHFEYTLQSALGANRNRDDFTQVRMSALGMPSMWGPMQVSRLVPSPLRPASPLWDIPSTSIGRRRSRVDYQSRFPNPFLDSVIDQLRDTPFRHSPAWRPDSQMVPPTPIRESIGVGVFNPRALSRLDITTPASAPTGGPVVPRMYMAREDWEDILHYGTVDDETPARPFPVPDRERLRAQEAQRAREDAQVFAALDRAANPPALDIDPTRPAPMRLRIPTFEIGRDTPLSPEELARLPMGAPVSLEEQVILERYHEQLRTEATQAVDEDILRTLAPHVPLDMTDMTGRFPMAMIPLDQGPTIRIDDVRNRRFNILGRRPVTVPPLSPDKPMTLPEMEKVALTIRRTFWEKLLDDEYSY